MTDHTVDALASCLPAGVVLDFGQGDKWHARRIATFQAQRLAEAGYALVLLPQTKEGADAFRELADEIHDAVVAEVSES